MSTDRIEKKIELGSPIARVWRVLTDDEEFGRWFAVRLESPFVPGKPSSGKLKVKGYEDLTMEVLVEKLEPERYFSFRWHPYAVDPKVDYSGEPRTLVEFTLEKTAKGTLLMVTESGFDALPPGKRRIHAFRMNTEGWTEQLVNVEKYLRENR